MTRRAGCGEPPSQSTVALQTAITQKKEINALPLPDFPASTTRAARTPPRFWMGPGIDSCYFSTSPFSVPSLYSRRALYPPQHSPAPQPAHRFSLRSPQDGSIFCLGSPRRPTSTSLARFPRRPEHGTARARLLARAPSSKSRRAFVGKTSDATLLSSRGG